MKETVDLLIEGGVVVTVDGTRRIFLNGGIAVRNNRIVAVDKSEKILESYRGEKVIQAGGKVVIPGLIDCHSHNHQSLIKALPFAQPPGKGPVWTRINTPFEAAMTEEEAKVASLLGCIQMLKSGTTCYADAGPFNPGNVDALGEGIKETGIRCALARASFDTLRYETSSDVPGFETTDDSVTNNEAFIKKWNGTADGRIRAWVVSSSIWGNSDEYFVRNKELVHKYGVGLHTHLNYARGEIALAYSLWGKRPLEHLEDIGVLSPNFLAVHMTLLSDREVQSVRASKTNVVHCPRTNLGVEPGGLMKASQMLASGINVAFGTDTKGGDIFDAMRLASYAHFLAWGMPYDDSLPLSFEDLIEMATINGAKALLWDEEIGSLEAGKKADIVIVDFRQPHLVPSYDVLAELVRLASGKDVETVIVDGQVVVENGVVTKVDENQIVDEARDCAAEIVARANLEKYVNPSSRFAYS